MKNVPTIAPLICIESEMTFLKVFNTCTMKE